MKKAYPTLFVFILLSQLFPQSWYVIDPVSIDGEYSFLDVYFTDDNTGWFANEVNILRTNNGCKNFSSQSILTGYIHAISMINTDYGYCGGDDGWIYKTNDGGDSWTLINSRGSTVIDISFPFNTDQNNPIGFACGDNGQVWKINGSTLTNLNTGYYTAFESISAPTKDDVWFCGGNHLVYYNGTTIIEQSGPGGTFSNIYFIDDQEGWVVGSVGLIGHTTNGGNTWETQANPDPQSRSLNKVFFLNTNEGWSVGVEGIILHTNDGGINWEVEGDGLTDNFLTSVYFTSSNNGYVVGHNNTIIKYGTPLATKDENSIPTSIELKQNFPNPFNPTTTISFNLDQERLVSLKVYDIIGNEVATILNERLNSGEHNIDFDGNGLANGMYVYELKSGEFIQTKKMLLMK